MVVSNAICCSGVGLNTMMTYISDETQNFPKANGLPIHRYKKDTVKELRIFCLDGGRGSFGQASYDRDKIFLYGPKWEEKNPNP